MAAHMNRLSWLFSSVLHHGSNRFSQFELCRRLCSSRIIQNDGSHAMVETADGNCIVCHHPTEPFPYEHSKPVPRPDPSKPEEAAESVLKMRLSHEKWSKEKQGPDVHELAKMFYTTKHRWYPLGIRKRSKAKRNSVRDRPYL